MLFLVKDPRNGFAVFTPDDPRNYGVAEGVEVNVALEEDDPNPGLWMDAEQPPDRVVGVHPGDPRRHRVFRSARDRAAAGFLAVGGKLVYVSTLGKYPFAATLSRARCRNPTCERPATRFVAAGGVRAPYCDEHAPRGARHFKTLPA
jgi:hypothetical protein